MSQDMIMFFLLLLKKKDIHFICCDFIFTCHSLLYLFVSVDTCMLFYLESYSLYTTVVNLTNFTKLCAKFQLDFGFLNKHEKKIMRLGILCSRVEFFCLFCLVFRQNLTNTCTQITEVYYTSVKYWLPLKQDRLAQTKSLFGKKKTKKT